MSKVTFKLKCDHCDAINELPLPWKHYWIVCNGCSQSIVTPHGLKKIKIENEIEHVHEYKPNFETWVFNALHKGADLTPTELLAAHGQGLMLCGLPMSILEKYAKQYTKITGTTIGLSQNELKAWAQADAANVGHHWDGTAWVKDPPDDEMTREKFLLGSMEEVLTMGTLKGTRLTDAKELMSKYKCQGELSEKAMEYFCDLLFEGYGIQKWTYGANKELIPNFTKMNPFLMPLTMIDG